MEIFRDDVDEVGETETSCASVDEAGEKQTSRDDVHEVVHTLGYFNFQTFITTCVESLIDIRTTCSWPEPDSQLTAGQRTFDTSLHVFLGIPLCLCA